MGYAGIHDKTGVRPLVVARNTVLQPYCRRSGGTLDATEHEEGKANWTQGRVGQSSPAKSAEVMSVMDGLASLYM